jgi:hypothetical protein
MSPILAILIRNHFLTILPNPIKIYFDTYLISFMKVKL